MRYAIISTYHLDALRLGEEYRIPYTGILGYLDYLENKTGEYVELDGSKDCDPGRMALYRYLAGLPHGHAPAGSRPYDLMAGKTEPDPRDWYSLQDLPLPYSARPSAWAMILGVPTELVTGSVGFRGCEIEWPEIYDWLVECEVVNLPGPLDPAATVKNETEPGLFD